MRFRTDEDGRVVKAGEQLRTYDQEVPTERLPVQLLASDFAGVGFVDDVMTWFEIGPPGEPIALTSERAADGTAD